MSNRYRNPFKIRATEKLETENNFLKMYSPNILGELLEKNSEGKLWSNILFIRSSPGAGKTSLLKILEPSSLLALSNNKSSNYYKDILDYLKILEIIDQSGKIHLLGVYMSCARNYEVIEDLNISDNQKKNMFFALVNARVILSTLRSLMSLYPNVKLDDIYINASSFDYPYLDFNFPINGNQLFEWAAAIEKTVFKALDSFLPINGSVEGHNKLFAFNLMQPSNILINNNQPSEKILFMFDDAHKLSKTQRDYLFTYLTIQRANYNIWIAERLEALDIRQILGSFIKRDYDEINLEEIWQAGNKFKIILGNIAQKRASLSSEGLSSFQDYLEDHLKESDFEEKFNQAYQQSEQNIRSLSSYGPKFNDWILYLEQQSVLLTPFQKAILAKQTEIIVNRNIGKTQLAFNFPLTEDELMQKLGGEVQTTALFLICIEYKIPYYYGFDNLVKLSSNNIDQFLSFAGDLFELMLARKISDRSISLDAIEQERVLRRIVENKWRELSRLIPYSDSILNFLQNLASIFQKDTYKLNAPYAPGVNGFAIKEPLENKLIKNEYWMKDQVFIPLIHVLSTCLAYNLLEKRITRQGKENQQWTVYYFNRWICMRFNLPLSYGGFRHKSPAELLKMTK